MIIRHKGHLKDLLDSVWFTADQHFHHANIIKYCGRPYSSVEEMNQALIDNWNSVVEPGHVVYSLGDFCLGSWHQFRDIAKQLNGEIRIVPGGHDKRWLKTARNSRFVQVLQPIEVLKLGNPDLTVVISHYAQRSWEQVHYGSYHLYGHSHGLLPGIGRSMDVGVDCHGYKPVPLHQVIIDLSRYAPIKDHIEGSRQKALRERRES